MHHVPFMAGQTGQGGMGLLPSTSTHDQHWESNPRPFDLEVQCPIHSATCPLTETAALISFSQCINVILGVLKVESEY